MTGLEAGPVIALLTLGGVHGVNPAMGWLFAVALGLQEKRGRAVWRALPPLALGHACAVLAVVAVGMLIGGVIRPDFVRLSVATVLLVFGVSKLVRGHRHPRYGGMRVGPRELTVWSFLMASAHGAGLMVLPFVLGVDVDMHAGHTGHGTGTALMAGQGRALGSAALHTVSYLVVTGTVALVVYHKLGLRLLRTAWVNLDVIWAAALIATALITLLL